MEQNRLHDNKASTMEGVKGKDYVLETPYNTLDALGKIVLGTEKVKQ